MTVQELPEFPNDNTERIAIPEKRNTSVEKSGKLNLVLMVFLSVILSTLISGSLIFSDTAKDRVLSVFGIQPEQKPDPLLPIRNQITQLLADQQQVNDSLKKELSDVRVALSNSDISRETLINRIVTIEKNSAAFRNETVKKLEAQKQSLVAAQKAKAAAAAKPKEPVNPVSIVSVRGWGNTGFVTLKEGLDYSELLTVGDSWRGWHVLSVDANARKATFRVHDQVKELVM
jgi:hypothetical protein